MLKRKGVQRKDRKKDGHQNVKKKKEGFCSTHPVLWVAVFHQRRSKCASCWVRVYRLACDSGFLAIKLNIATKYLFHCQKWTLTRRNKNTSSP